MPASIPYPNSPQAGDAPDPTVIRANFQALLQAIQNFDASQIQAASLQEAAFAAAVNPRLRGSESLPSFISTGCFWTAVSGFTGTMSSGVMYRSGYRIPVAGVPSKIFTANRDTYIDIDNNGNVSDDAVNNNAPAPVLAPNSRRVAEVITDAAGITQIITNDYDSLGNLIYNPKRQYGMLTGTSSYDASLTLPDGATNTTAFTFTVPSDWDGGSWFSVYVMMRPSVSSGTAVLRRTVTTYRDGKQNIATESSVNANRTFSTDTNVSVLQGRLTQAATGNAFKAGDIIRVELQRLGSDGADTLAGNLEIRGAMLVYGWNPAVNR